MNKAKKIPIEVGDELILDISGLTTQGEGVGRYENFTIFVPNTLVGEKVRAGIEKVKKNYGQGRLIDIIVESAQRVEPPCPYYSLCGGCQLLHLDYQGQLEFKRQTVVDAMERIGGLKELPVLPVIGMEFPCHYRNKGQYHPAQGKGGLKRLGFYEKGSHRVVDIKNCLIQHPLNNNILNRLRHLLMAEDISIYNRRAGRGLLRDVLLQVGFQSKEAMVIFITNGARFPAGRRMAEKLLREFPAIKSVVQNINPVNNKQTLGSANRILAGRSYIVDILNGFEFIISPTSFFQINPPQTEILYNLALEYAELTGEETVLDAYCGVGTVSLHLAKGAKAVFAIEANSEALADARENAARNGIENVSFFGATVEERLPKLITAGTHFDVAVVDPPRSGCRKEVLESFAQAQINRIIYISCNPATLARDLQYLTHRGYKPEVIQPVDMFPHTYHVETVVLITRVKG